MNLADGGGGALIHKRGVYYEGGYKVCRAALTLRCLPTLTGWPLRPSVSLISNLSRGVTLGQRANNELVLLKLGNVYPLHLLILAYY